jgi:hypothetical protein
LSIIAPVSRTYIPAPSHPPFPALTYNKATTPATIANAPGTWYTISPPDLAVADADTDAEPVADPVADADEAALDVADEAEPAELEAAELAEEEAEEAEPGAPKVPPVPITTVGVTMVAFEAALM